MPLVHIDILEGRSPAVTAEPHIRVAQLVAQIFGSPPRRRLTRRP